MDESKEKEVYFNVWCKECKYEKTDEFEDPCNDCLNCPSNDSSHKPINFKAKEE